MSTTPAAEPAGAGRLSRRRRLLLWAIALVLVAVVVGGGAVVWLQQQGAPAATVTDDVPGPAMTGDRIVFRNTEIGDDYGLVAALPLTRLDGDREVSRLACDRVDATDTATVCLRARRGILTTFEALELDATGTTLRRWPLPGIPSRTRIDPAHGMVATTSFVTGHAYDTIGFSTETMITDASGMTSGNLEDFALMVDGERITAIDRNIWGVTFTGDGQHFYATAASGDTTWLVEGDLDERTITAIREGVECPSLSPDGTRIAFKSLEQRTPAYWSVAVLDLATGTVTAIPGERSVDDQIEWLDDETIIYGMPREGVIGDSDVWAAAADGSAEPRLLIEHAWSPSVVRG